MAASLNIIVVEDHDDLRETTVAALADMGHNARGVASAESLDDAMTGFSADLLVLDLNLPGEDGISLAKRLRAVQPHLGIIMVTARAHAKDKTAGYNSGADIYLTKPTSIEELGAAVSALGRRIRPVAAGSGGLHLHPIALQIRGHEAVDISSLEGTLLSAFIRAPDHRLEHWQLLELAGKPLDEASKSALEVQIARLRKKLQQAGASGPAIKSIRGAGYQLCVAIDIRD